MSLKITNKIIDELIRDKQDLKEQLKLHKKKIRKQKSKFKTLYKVISEQHSLQYIPEIKKQVELELRSKKFDMRDINNGSVSSHHYNCQNTTASYDTFQHHDNRCGRRHPRSINRKINKMISLDQHGSKANQSTNSIIRIYPENTVESKVFNYERKSNTTVDNHNRDSADLGYYLDFKNHQNKYLHSRKPSQSAYSISKLRDKSMKILDEATNKRHSGFSRKESALNSQNCSHSNINDSHCISNTANASSNQLLAMRAECNQTPIHEITNLLQTDEIMELDSRNKIFKSMDDQMVKIPENLKSISDIEAFCIEQTENLDATNSQIIADIESKENINNNNFEIKQTSQLNQNEKHTKSMQKNPKAKIGVSLRKMIKGNKPMMTFGNKTAELKPSLINSEPVTSNENTEINHCKDGVNLKNTFSNNTIGLLKEIEDIDDEIRGLLSMIAKH